MYIALFQIKQKHNDKKAYIYILVIRYRCLISRALAEKKIKMIIDETFFEILKNLYSLETTKILVLYSLPFVIVSASVL